MRVHPEDLLHHHHRAPQHLSRTRHIRAQFMPIHRRQLYPLAHRTILSFPLLTANLQPTALTLASPAPRTLSSRRSSAETASPAVSPSRTSPRSLSTQSTPPTCPSTSPCASADTCSATAAAALPASRSTET